MRCVDYQYRDMAYQVGGLGRGPWRTASTILDIM